MAQVKYASHFTGLAGIQSAQRFKTPFRTFEFMISRLFRIDPSAGCFARISCFRSSDCQFGPSRLSGRSSSEALLKAEGHSSVRILIPPHKPSDSLLEIYPGIVAEFFFRLGDVGAGDGDISGLVW